jgi:serine/threonine protein kinase
MDAADDHDDRTVIKPLVRPTEEAAHDDERTRMVAQAVVPTHEQTPAPNVAAKAGAAEAQDHGNGLRLGTSIAEFEITQVVGEGGFGIVYLATDHSLQRRVALKEYMPSSLAMRSGATAVQVKSARYRETFDAGLKSFINEARLLASFDHPSLVKVYRFWEANGTAYMVMPFYEGRTLKDHLRQLEKPPDEAWLRDLLTPLTQALEVIHADQCYHRDIAPDNVILLGNSHQRPLLLDFGAARRVIGDMTQALTVILKPGYAPVEQYAEIPDMKQGAWTDVYALAAVVYFAITGKTPPPSVGRMLNDNYVPLAQSAAGRYDAHFLEALDRALVVRAEARTPSIAQLRFEMGLDATPLARAGAAVSVPRDSRSPSVRATGAPSAPVTSSARRARWMGLAAGLALLGICVAAWYALAPSPRPNPVQPPTTGPAVQATPPATPTPQTASLDASREFSDLVREQTAGFSLEAKPTRSQARIGRDDLGFTLQTPRAGWLYVFALASDGTLAQVVPNTVSGAVRLRPGQPYRFPSGNGVVLEAAEPAGTVELLLMVSANERDFSALEPEKAGPMRLIKTGAAAASIVERHVGASPLLAGRVLCPKNSACDESYGANLLKVQVVN